MSLLSEMLLTELRKPKAESQDSADWDEIIEVLRDYGMLPTGIKGNVKGPKGKSYLKQIKVEGDNVNFNIQLSKKNIIKLLIDERVLADNKEYDIDSKTGIKALS